MLLSEGPNERAHASIGREHNEEVRPELKGEQSPLEGVL